MNYRAHTAVSLAALFCLFLAGCGEDAGASGNLRVTRVAYDYSGPYGRYQIADSAEAYSGKTLVGKAQLMELLGSPSETKRTLKIKIAHFDASQHQTYLGYIYVEPAFTTGRLIREEPISGEKTAAIFKGWQFGN